MDLIIKNKFEILVLIIGWSSFLVWEYYVQQWADSQPAGGGAIIRVDLLILLPALIALTVWSILRMQAKN